MKEQFREILETLRTLDISVTPNYRTMKALANHPEAYYPMPEVVAAKVKINVNEDFVNDEALFNETLDCYVKCLSRIYSQLKADFPMNHDQMFAAMVDSLNLTLTYTF